MSDLLANLPNVRAILFDMDGTLIDTDNLMVEKWARRFDPILRHRATPFARWLAMTAEGPGNFVFRTIDALGLEQAMASFTDWMHRQRGLRNSAEFHLIPGVDEMLPQLTPPYKLGIVSTRSRTHIMAFRERFPKLSPLFSAECGIQDTRSLKPSPAPIFKAAEKLNVLPAECIMVGDTPVDMLAARRAGAWAIGVLCGFGHRDELEHAGAHVILPSTAEVADFLNL